MLHYLNVNGVRPPILAEHVWLERGPGVRITRPGPDRDFYSRVTEPTKPEYCERGRTLVVILGSGIFWCNGVTIKYKAENTINIPPQSDCFYFEVYADTVMHHFPL